MVCAHFRVELVRSKESFKGKKWTEGDAEDSVMFWGSGSFVRQVTVMTDFVPWCSVDLSPGDSGYLWITTVDNSKMCR